MEEEAIRAAAVIGGVGEETTTVGDADAVPAFAALPPFLRSVPPPNASSSSPSPSPSSAALRSRTRTKGLLPPTTFFSKAARRRRFEPFAPFVVVVPAPNAFVTTLVEADAEALVMSLSFALSPPSLLSSLLAMTDEEKDDEDEAPKKRSERRKLRVPPRFALLSLLLFSGSAVVLSSVLE